MFIVTGRNKAGREYVDCSWEQEGIPHVGANMRAKGYEPHHFDEWRWSHHTPLAIRNEPVWFHSQFPWPAIW